jgi:alkylation response protein AidB-like acyl-CoA dehydrogenase
LILKSETTKNYLALTKSLTEELAATAVERDRQGGTPKRERDAIRKSGLLNLTIPKEYGGWGDNWISAMKVSRELGKVDSSIAHVLSYHYLGAVIPHILGSAAQRKYYYYETVRHGWFWCNALNPLDRRATLTPDGTNFRLEGIKSFCSGSKDSDILPITAVNSATDELMVLILPTQREGIVIGDDWDNMGQRQTDSGSITFDRVLVYPDEILASRNQPKQPFQTIRACLTQLNLANIYLGIAQGALAAAKEYTRTTTRPWFASGVEKASQDPYILQRYGNLWVDLQAATCLTDRAGESLQAAWERQWTLTAEQRGECAIAIATAKVAASRVGLEIANQIFDLMGARATDSKYGFDRYWRNLRTFTLHDPVDYKVQAIGNWVLNDNFPTPDFYS